MRSEASGASSPFLTLRLEELAFVFEVSPLEAGLLSQCPIGGGGGPTSSYHCLKRRNKDDKSELVQSGIVGFIKKAKVTPLQLTCLQHGQS